MSISRWTNRPGEIYGEITIRFLSSGYYDPGKMSGLPENCYPPEGDDERTMDSVVIDFGDTQWTLPPPMAQEIFDHFQEHVDAKEIGNEPDEPDYDSIAEEREVRRNGGIDLTNHFNERYTNVLRFVIRDDTSLIHCNDSPSYRTVEIQLTAEQSAAITLGTNEWISRAFLEPVP